MTEKPNELGEKVGRLVGWSVGRPACVNTDNRRKAMQQDKEEHFFQYIELAKGLQPPGTVSQPAKRHP